MITFVVSPFSNLTLLLILLHWKNRFSFQLMTVYGPVERVSSRRKTSKRLQYWLRDIIIYYID